MTLEIAIFTGCTILAGAIGFVAGVMKATGYWLNSDNGREFGE